MGRSSDSRFHASAGMMGRKANETPSSTRCVQRRTRADRLSRAKAATKRVSPARLFRMFVFREFVGLLAIGSLVLTLGCQPKASPAQTKLLERYAWSVPTIVGQTMYIRDEGQIMAVDLG